LQAFFSPRSVAVIGAAEEPGRAVLRNLVSQPFGGTVYPINAEHSSVLGIRSCPTLADVPERIELAVVAAAAELVPAAISECIHAGVAAAIVVSGGFRETGPAGASLEHGIQQLLQGCRLRLLGPNSLGVMSPNFGLNATWAQTMARPGNLAFISQSNALSTAILDWSLREMMGFSCVVSVGSMLDVGWGDLIDYLGDDPRTHSIVCYMESIGDARSFLSAAREVTLTKPVIVLKTGRTEASASAARSHTGALAGSEEALQAAFRRCGVLSVASIGELFYMSEVLAKQPRPRGKRLAIVSNAGGPAVIAADALTTTGGELAELAPGTMAELDSFLPPNWSRGNPVDILGDADIERFSRALKLVANDPNSDGLMVVTAPQGLTSLTAIAEAVQPYSRCSGRPLLASFMGGPNMLAPNEILNRAGIPTFPFPDTAAIAFNYMWRYTYNLRGLYETPVIREAADPDRAAAAELLWRVAEAGRSVLTEYESKQLLAAYGIPIVDTRPAFTEKQAVALARAIGFPVVLKLLSETITHKSDVGGVQLSIRNEAGVRHAYRAIRKSVAGRSEAGDFLGVTVQPMIAHENGYELILGSSLDPQFGPVLLFGSGGQLAQFYRDRALALPPLNTTLARRMMEQTRIYTALQGIRGRPPVDLEALEQLLVRFSQLVVEQPRIKEIDINPLLASPKSASRESSPEGVGEAPPALIALDARVIVHEADVADENLPHSVIRPYPTQYVQPWATTSGIPLLIRPIRPEDEPLMVRFHEKLSERSVYLRYFQPLKLSLRIAHERLTRICFIDYDREMALVAVHREAPDGPEEIVAVGRLSRLHGVNEAECAVLVGDNYQRQGLGSELFRRLLDFARAERIGRLVSTMLPENLEMRAICAHLGFRVEVDMEESLVRAELQL
jgi:acetyltransferase